MVQISETFKRGEALFFFFFYQLQDGLAFNPLLVAYLS